jgi:Ser/Thr protein kinase RdoA (MazF antagonist)
MKIQPESQFKHSIDNVASLGRRYGITVSNYAEATSGIENTTLIVTGQDGKYVFRIYRQGKKTNAHIQAEIDFVAYLDKNHIPVPSVIKNSAGEDITVFESRSRQWQLVVMDFVKGSHPDTISPELLAGIATTQAQMHVLAANYTHRTGTVRTLTKLAETKFIRQINMAAIDERLAAFLQRGAAYEVKLDTELPTGLCHMDYNEQNMLCNDNAITAVLDFDDLSVAPYAVCLAYTLWHMQDSHGPAAADAYPKIYEQIRPLTIPEKRLLPATRLFRHYVVSAIKVLDGETGPKHIEEYLHVERSLQATIAGQ